MTGSNQIKIKSLLLSHHHSTSAWVSEILESVLQTVQKNKTIYILWHVSRAPISVALATEEIHLHAITAGWSVPAEAAQERATKAGTTQSLVSNDSRRQPTNDTLCFLPESSWPISPPHEHWTPNPLHAAGRRTGSRSTGEPLQTRWHLHFTLFVQ